MVGALGFALSGFLQNRNEGERIVTKSVFEFVARHAVSLFGVDLVTRSNLRVHAEVLSKRDGSQNVNVVDLRDLFSAFCVPGGFDIIKLSIAIDRFPNLIIRERVEELFYFFLVTEHFYLHADHYAGIATVFQGKGLS